VGAGFGKRGWRSGETLDLIIFVIIILFDG